MDSAYDCDWSKMHDHLEKTSRSFVIPISMLDKPEREEVAVAYLLLRIADSFEDATHWDCKEKVEALDLLGYILVNQRRSEGIASLVALCDRRPPLDHLAYLELIRDLNLVICCLNRLDPFIREIITHHVTRSIRGMAYFVVLSDQSVPDLSLSELGLLRSYCYCVAGVVGELFTDIAVKRYPALMRHVFELEKLAPFVGEVLQLANILEDTPLDRSEGRRYMPKQVPVMEVACRIREGYQRAKEYLDFFLDVGAPFGCVAFVSIAVLMAMEHLYLIEGGVRDTGISPEKMEVLVEQVRSRIQHSLNPLESIHEDGTIGRRK